MKTTKLAGHSVPVTDGLAIAYFSSGQHGPKEKGFYQFWTAICLEKGNQAGVTGRALRHLDAAERFRRIEKEKLSAKSAADRKAYARLWKRLQSPLYIRAATPAEVGNWLVTHPHDSPFLKSLRFTK